jgi:predicted enzyme related to lactoylglutathione lyase
VTEVLGIDNVLISVGDLDEAARFYADKLGLPVRMRFDEAGIVLFGIGPEEPGLLARRSEEPTSARLWLEVPDARQTAEVLAGRGVTPLAPPFNVHTGWTVEVADPWGNVIGFTDYTLQPERGRTPVNSRD